MTNKVNKSGQSQRALENFIECFRQKPSLNRFLHDQINELKANKIDISWMEKLKLQEGITLTGMLNLDIPNTTDFITVSTDIKNNPKNYTIILLLRIRDSTIDKKNITWPKSIVDLSKILSLQIYDYKVITK